MDNKLNRITAFIDSLPIDNDRDADHSVVLPTEMELLGAGDNSGNCSNYMLNQCKKSKNGGDCKNYGVCADSKNEGNCENLIAGPIYTNPCAV